MGALGAAAFAGAAGFGGAVGAGSFFAGICKGLSSLDSTAFSGSGVFLISGAGVGDGVGYSAGFSFGAITSSVLAGGWPAGAPNGLADIGFAVFLGAADASLCGLCGLELAGVAPLPLPRPAAAGPPGAAAENTGLGGPGFGIPRPREAISGTLGFFGSRFHSKTS